MCGEVQILPSEQSGFVKEIGHSFLPPYPLQYPFGWTGMMLNGTAVPDMPVKFDRVAALSKPDLW